MKTYVLTLAVCFLGLIAFGQTNTQLRIFHRMGAGQLTANGSYINNFGNEFQVTRIQYYLTRFTVIHDGGQETVVPDDTIALVTASVFGQTPYYSDIDLGALSLTNVEGIRFHIGVFSPANNEDPSLLPEEHPLAPKYPSMHWGWASGYRFLVYEGKAGANFSQLFQMHALGNSNYLEVSVTPSSELVNGTMVIGVDADYQEGVNNINLAAGPIAHGTNQQDYTCLINFQNDVFSASQEDLSYVSGLNTLESQPVLTYPNPTADGRFVVEIPTSSLVDEVRITTLVGTTIVAEKVESGIHEFTVPESGVYVVQYLAGGELMQTSHIVKQ